MKVSELIAELSKAPPDLEVITEGCDCDGDAGSVIIEEDRVYIRRGTIIDIEAEAHRHAELVEQQRRRDFELRKKYPQLR